VVATETLATGTLPNRPNRRNAELQLELAGAFSLLLSACMRARRLMAQARERGIEPKLAPEVEAMIKAYDELDSVRTMKGERAYLENCEQVLGQ
jgi:cytidylate kinase